MSSGERRLSEVSGSSFDILDLPSPSETESDGEARSTTDSEIVDLTGEYHDLLAGEAEGKTQNGGRTVVGISYGVYGGRVFGFSVFTKTLPPTKSTLRLIPSSAQAEHSVAPTWPNNIQQPLRHPLLRAAEQQRRAFAQEQQQLRKKPHLDPPVREEPASLRTLHRYLSPALRGFNAETVPPRRETPPRRHSAGSNHFDGVGF